MMESTGLKCSCVWMRFGEAVFPKAYLSFDGEFQIVRRAEEVNVVGHEQIITHEPRRGGVLPDVVQCPLNRSLRQPAFAFLRADSEEYPIWSAERNVDALRRSAASGVAEWDFAHGGQSIARRNDGKDLDGAERQLCPTESNCGRAALPCRLAIAELVGFTKRAHCLAYQRTSYAKHLHPVYASGKCGGDGAL